VWNSRRLVLAHLWFAFAGFGAALLLGEWQMYIRNPLHAWISDPEWYYRSVTAHGTTMAYVFPTLVAMSLRYGSGGPAPDHAIARGRAGAGLSLISWYPTTTTTCRFIGRPKSSPATG
jgi:cytochrome c oxidase subunit I